MKKYLLNKKTGTLHQRGCCYHTKGIEKIVEKEYLQFDSYDEAVKSQGMFKKDCKICFKGK